MTLNDFKSHKKGINDFYKDYIPRITDIVEACKEPLKVRNLLELTVPVTLPNGNLVSKAVALCIACISSIDLKYPRKAMLSLDEKEFIAGIMVQRYSHWSVTELKCFELMLIMARLPTLRNGQVEYELPAISIPTILGKAEAYDKMRPQSVIKNQEDDNPKSMAALLQQELFGWRKSPFNIYDDYHKTHDCNGNLMVDPVSCGGTPMRKLDWDYESHWDQWYRSHLVDGSPAPEGFDAETYWKTEVRDVSWLDQLANLTEVMRKKWRLGARCAALQFVN